VALTSAGNLYVRNNSCNSVTDVGTPVILLCVHVGVSLLCLVLACGVYASSICVPRCC
jgi:hypothetical protein